MSARRRHHLVLELVAGGQQRDARELVRHLRPWAADLLLADGRKPRLRDSTEGRLVVGRAQNGDAR